MIRKIIKIDEDKCNGCGLCIDACHEGALQLVDGKAKLISESYCDGLGDCLPECPTGAITIEEREAEPFDEEAVKTHARTHPNPGLRMPGTHARTIQRKTEEISPTPAAPQPAISSQLQQWPCQIKLVPVNAPYFNNAHLWWQQTVQHTLMQIFIKILCAIKSRSLAVEIG